MSPNWMVSVGGHAYGPYTAAQMQMFAVEGRLVAHSLVAQEGGEFGPASEDPLLATLFHVPERPTLMEKGPAPADDAPKSFGQTEAPTDEPSHFLIIADMKSGSITALEDEIHRLGPAYAVMPQGWVLACELSLSAVRNTLVQKLGKLDLLFIADASHDKITWFNIGMEAETRIRRIWTKPQAQLSAA
jgi:hypothetical protein